jgi:hypothetical protein
LFIKDLELDNNESTQVLVSVSASKNYWEERIEEMKSQKISKEESFEEKGNTKLSIS